MHHAFAHAHAIQVQHANQEVKTVADERATRRYRRLSDDEWEQVDDAWAAGDVTLIELSETFDVAVRTLQNHFAAHGVQKGAPVGGFDIVIPDDPNVSLAGDIKDIEAQAIEVRTRTISQAREVGAQLMSSVRALRTDGTMRPAAAVRTLVAAASALERLHEIERKALSLDQHEFAGRELPVLVLDNITDAMIASIQRGDDDANDDEVYEDVASL